MAVTAAPFRLLRVGLFGSAILCLSAGGHLAAGGRLPGMPIMAALVALTLVPVVILTRLKLSFVLLLALLGSGQLVLHAAFCALSTPLPRVSPMFGMPMSALHAGFHGGEPSALMPAVLPDAGAQSAMSAAWSPGMIAAHVLATIATAAVLARGERAFWNLIQWLRPLLGCLHPPVRVDAPAGPAGFVPQIAPVCGGHVRLPALRGPPTGVRAA